MDFGNEEDTNLIEAHASIEPQQSQKINTINESMHPLMVASFIDGKTMKNFFNFLPKIHKTVKLEFYEHGIWGVQIRQSERDISGQTIEAVSTLHFPKKKMYDYVFNSYLLDPPSEEGAKPFFSLKIQPSALQKYFRTLKADAPMVISYTKGSETLMFYNDVNMTTGFPLHATFELTSTRFPITEDIGKADFESLVNVKLSEFCTVVNNLTKVKEQLSNTMFLELQYNYAVNRSAFRAYSSEGTFNYGTQFFDINSPPNCRFVINSHIFQGLGGIESFNHRGFMETLCLDESVIRLRSQVGNVGVYNIFIIPSV